MKSESKQGGQHLRQNLFYFWDCSRKSGTKEHLTLSKLAVYVLHILKQIQILLAIQSTKIQNINSVHSFLFATTTYMFCVCVDCFASDWLTQQDGAAQTHVC
jgi:hypothetical protein